MIVWTTRFSFSLVGVYVPVVLAVLVLYGVLVFLYLCLPLICCGLFGEGACERLQSTVFWTYCLKLWPLRGSINPGLSLILYTK